MRRAILSLFIFVFFLLSGYFMAGGRIVVILHPLPMFVVLVTFSVVGSLLAIYPFSSIKQAMNPGESPANAAMAVRVWRHAEVLSYLAGILGCAIGFSISANYMDMPINVIGGKFAASLVGVVLGTTQGVFFRFLRMRSE